MSDITLSSGIRQNLLSLQQTSADLTTTQEALATGKSVNSAADNPSAYFTSQNLTNSSNSLSALLDQIGQGSQTINAATDGLTQLTSLLQQALSTVEQAQSASWTTAASTTATANLGAGTGSTTATLDLRATAASTGTVDLSSATNSASGSVDLTTNTAAAGNLLINAGGSSFTVAIAASASLSTIESDINTAVGGAVTATDDGSGHLTLSSTTGSFAIVDNATAEAVGLTTSGSNTTSTATLNNPVTSGTLTIDAGGSSYAVSIGANSTLSQVETAINSATSGAVTATDDGAGHLVLDSSSAGSSSGIVVENSTTSNSLGLTSGSAASTTTASVANAVTAGSFTIQAGGSSYAVSIAANSTLSQVESAINSATGGAVTATDNGSGHLVLNDSAGGFTVDNSSTSNSLGLTTGSSNSTAAVSGAGGANNSLAAGNLLIAVGSTTYSVSIAASSSLSQIETAINGTTGLGASGAVTATDDGNGHLILTSNNAPSSLTIVDNTTSEALGLTTTGSDNVASGSSATRSTLQTNYNGLLTQINGLVADSGYSGVNLLSGDNLKIDFNSTGSSQLTIQGVNFDAQGLGLSTISGSKGTGSFQSDDQLTSIVASLNQAISTVQTQTETFGTNSSTISTRQSFTNAMINTLQTGASNLVAADQNQESANLLTEQTQQQLEISALSIANQANQSVLKLFG